MVHLIATCLLLLASPAADSKTSVRVGLFSLFQPQQLNVRLGSGEAFTLSAGRQNDTQVLAGEIVRLRKTGRQIQISVMDAYGRLRFTSTAEEAHLTPLNSAALELNLPRQMTRAVRGMLTVTARAPASPNALQIVLLAEREAAVASVVAAEMSGMDRPEALKALAVVVRTFM